MNLQYISDSEGKTTGVFIPINDWNDLKKKYVEIEQEENNIPDWHKDMVRERLENYRKNPDSALDFDAALNDIEKEL
ncbi:MAG: addiction module protein [Prolixibacteraceae bacterium]|nr:addiction module protein [Prolixibacteraceae bacterium]